MKYYEFSDIDKNAFSSKEDEIDDITSKQFTMGQTMKNSTFMAMTPIGGHEGVLHPPTEHF